MNLVNRFTVCLTPGCNSETSISTLGNGFTIIELLIVIVVIGILAGLVLTAFTGIQQKARDTDRMLILTEEMKVEERKLAALKQDFNNGEPERRGDERNFAKYQDRVASMKDDVSRTEKNIEALKREIGNLK